MAKHINCFFVKVSKTGGAKFILCCAKNDTLAMTDVLSGC